MPAGQEIAFKPALTGVFAEDFHHPALRRQVIVIGIVGSSQVRPVASNTACSRLEAVSSGPNRRKFGRLAFA